MFASSIIVAAGCSKEEPARPVEEVAKPRGPEKMPEGAKLEEAAKPSELSAPVRKE